MSARGLWWCRAQYAGRSKGEPLSRPGPKWSGRNPPHTQQFAAGAQPRGPTFTFCNAWESSGRKRHADSSGMLGDLDGRRTEKGRRNGSSLRVTNAPKGVDGAWLLKVTNNHSTFWPFVPGTGAGLSKDLHSPRLNDQLLIGFVQTLVQSARWAGRRESSESSTPGTDRILV